MDLAGKLARAEVRRTAFRTVLAERGLTPTKVARMAGFDSPNAITNFLAGQTRSLNMDIAEPLARVLQISLNELVGDGSFVLVRCQTVFLKGAIASDRWQPKNEWEEKEWRGFVMPRDEHRYADKSYLMRLETEEMNEIWKPNTLLEIVSLADFEGEICAGTLVRVDKTNRDGFIEMSCREITMPDDGVVCHLVSRSTDPRFTGRVTPVPWPLTSGRVDTLPNGDRLEVRGVVIRSLHDELPGE